MSNFSDYNAGNLLSLTKDDNEWNEKIKNSEICISKTPVDILLPWCLTMHEAKLLCTKYRGQMTIIRSPELQAKLFLSLEGITETVNCLIEDQVWTGFFDEQEGHFIDANEEKPIRTMIDPVPFHPSQPNGERAENCVEAYKKYPHGESWFDTYCNRRSIPFFCRVDNNPRVQIRGERSLYVGIITILKINSNTIHFQA